MLDAKKKPIGCMWEKSISELIFGTKKKGGGGRFGCFFCVLNVFANVKHDLGEMTAKNRFEKPVQPDELE